MNEENTNPKAAFVGRLKNLATNKGVQFTMVAVATAVLTHKLTLTRAFTFDQMNVILANEDLTKALIGVVESVKE